MRANFNKNIRYFNFLFLLYFIITNAESLPRLVSTNLCADLLLLTLASPEQILSVSYQSQDPQLSPITEQAKNYPANHGSIEEILYFKPEIAFVYQGWQGRNHTELLARQGIQIIALPYPRSWEDTLNIARHVASVIHANSQSLAQIETAAQRMQTLQHSLPPLRVLYLRSNGGTAGAGTYVNEILTQIGLKNLAAERGYFGWGTFPLEYILLSEPDIFLLGYFEQKFSNTQNNYARHPLINKLFAQITIIKISGNTWGCGGLEIINAAEKITHQIKLIKNLK